MVRLSQPEEMKTDRYVYGVDVLNGHDAWAMFEACAAGDLAAVKKLLTTDPKLVNAQYWYQFPLHHAVRLGHEAIVEQLFQSGADPGQSRFMFNAWSELLEAAGMRGHDRIEAMLSSEMTKRFNYSPEFDPLKRAIQAGDMEQADAALSRKPELIAAADARGNSVLHWCVITRRIEMLDHFLRAGARIDAPRADGQSPVLLAATGATDYWYRAPRQSSYPTLRDPSVLVGFLLARGAAMTLSLAISLGIGEAVASMLREDPAAARRLDSARISPLAHAAREGHLHIVRMLLQNGADPNMPEDLAPRGAALFNACCRNDVAMAQMLLDSGADPNAGMDSSGTCYTIAEVYNGRDAKEIRELLLRHGACIPPYAMTAQQLKQAVRESSQVTKDPEFLGAVIGHRDRELFALCLDSDDTLPLRLQPGGLPRQSRLRRLLERGLDPNRTDWLGRTFLHFAASSGDWRCAALLLDAGADIHAREIEHGGTPLAAAVRNLDSPEDAERSRRMVRFLLKRGASPDLPEEPAWASPRACANRLGRTELLDLLDNPC